MNTIAAMTAGRQRRLTNEMRLTLALFGLAFFGLGVPRVFTATAADTIFLGAYGAKFLAYSYLAQAILVPVFGHIYIKAEERFSLRALLLGSMAIDVGVQLLLWSGLTVTKFPPIAFLGNIWAEAEFIFSSLWLWGLATHLMTLRQGKRLFGYIGAGEPLAIIAAGALMPIILKFTGIKELFLLSGVSVGVSLLIAAYILTQFKSPSHADDEEEEGTIESPGVSKWYSSLYVQVLVGIVIISQFAFYFTDNVFYLEAGARFPEEEELGAFIGKYMAVVGVLSLCVSLFVSGPLLKRFGLRSALLVLPILLALMAGFGWTLGIGDAAVGVVFWVVVIIKTVDQSVRYSIDKTASVTLYAPMAAGLRTQVQAGLESIIEPVVGGVAGLILAVLVQFLDFGSVAILAVIFIVAAAWIFLVFFQDKFYQKALRQALQSRRMGAGQLTVEDPAAIAVITEALRSPNAGEVLNSLALLDRIAQFDLTACYRDLLNHPAPEVRRDVLRRIEVLGPGNMPVDLIAARAKAETDPALRAEALRTLAALDPDGALDHLEPFLTSPDEPVRREAFVGLLRHGGIEGILCAGEPLLAALRSHDAGQRRFAAGVLEGIHSPGFARALTSLMADSDASVRSAALRAVGVAQTPSMWPRAVTLLADEIGDVSRTAAYILASAGDAAVEPLLELLDGPGVPSDARRLAARVLGEIGTATARTQLIGRLDLPDRKVAEAVLFAISAHSINPDNATTKHFMTRLGDILQDVAQATAWRTVLTAEPLTDIDPVLHRALGDQIDDDIKSIFRLLTLIYPEAGLGDAWQNFRFGDPDRKAVAMEALEVALRNEYRVQILALIEHDGDAARLEAIPLAIRPPLVKGTDVPDLILTQSSSLISPWTRAAALYSILQLGNVPAGAIRSSSFLLDEPLCRELLDHNAGGGEMLTIEKVLVLRNTRSLARCGKNTWFMSHNGQNR